MGIEKSISLLVFCILILRETFCDPVNGKIFLLGGATSDSSISIYNQLRLATNKEAPSIAVVISAAPSLADGLDAYNVNETGSLSYRDLFIRYGFQPTVLELAIDNYEVANSYETPLGRENIEKIQNADVVFFNGGDQSRHSRAWLKSDGSDTDIMTVLRSKFADGTVIAGTSAGMAVQGEYTFGAGRSYGYYYFNADLKFCNIGDEFEDDRDPSDIFRSGENGAYLQGFGFIQKILVDTHFDARGRFVRLIVAMRKIGVTLGFGVDENTVLYIENDTAAVYGEWGVWIIDTSEARIPDESRGSLYFSAENIRIHYLTEGDSYNLTSGNVFSTKPSIVEQETSIVINNNIFGLDQGLRTMKSLISSNSTASEGYSREEDPTCMVIFEKDEKTKGHIDDDDQYTVKDLLLHIQTKNNSTAESAAIMLYDMNIVKIGLLFALKTIILCLFD
ncbi:cyanophycinase-like [Bradysia coprophila]|uniref:cyanophycinase-like n=1 Tax=Bradysia coprophila TaxID=38358 RepID=UPI00187DCE21|nr:cyanophycinase-like [Bradysia coprophila]